MRGRGAAMCPAGQVSDPATADADAVRPFRIDVPQEELDDLKRRVAATRWPTRETVPDQGQGGQLATDQPLARHWATHDWRDVAARLHALPQFLTTIPG